MTKKRISKLVHEGEYVAEVEVELIYTDAAEVTCLTPIAAVFAAAMGASVLFQWGSVLPGRGRR